MENKKILFIDDDEMLREMFSLKLRQVGFVVEEAVDGQEGLKKIETTAPALILLDVIMPKLDGFQMLEIMKKNSAWKDLPVIILTNLAHEDDRKEALLLGAKEYVVKSSVTPGELVEKVKKYLEKTG